MFSFMKNDEEMWSAENMQQQYMQTHNMWVAELMQIISDIEWKKSNIKRCIVIYLISLVASGLISWIGDVSGDTEIILYCICSGLVFFVSKSMSLYKDAVKLAYRLLGWFPFFGWIAGLVLAGTVAMMIVIFPGGPILFILFDIFKTRKKFESEFAKFKLQYPNSPFVQHVETYGMKLPETVQAEMEAEAAQSQPVQAQIVQPQPVQPQPVQETPVQPEPEVTLQTAPVEIKSVQTQPVSVQSEQIISTPVVHEQSQVAQEQPPVVLSAPQPDKRFCIHCGKERVAGAAFCAFCGKPFEEVTHSTSETVQAQQQSTPVVPQTTNTNTNKTVAPITNTDTNNSYRWDVENDTTEAYSNQNKDSFDVKKMGMIAAVIVGMIVIAFVAAKMLEDKTGSNHEYEYTEDGLLVEIEENDAVSDDETTEGESTSDTNYLVADHNTWNRVYVPEEVTDVFGSYSGEMGYLKDFSSTTGITIACDDFNSIKMNFPEEVILDGIAIIPAMCENIDSYYNYSRLSQIRVTGDDGSSAIYDIVNSDSGYEIQSQYLEYIDFYNPMKTTTLTIEMVNMYEGNAISDIGFSELYAYVYAMDSDEYNESWWSISYNADTEGYEETQYEEVSGDFVFPDSSERYLDESELDGLDEYDVRRALNEIYARNGYEFTNSSAYRWYDYFSQFDWYNSQELTRDMDMIYRNFNDCESSNVNMIERYEQEHGWR